MSADDPVFFATISEINAALKQKKFSCVELTRAFCDRLERLGPRYNCLALSLREQAIRKSKEVDGDLKKDRQRSPLQGVPYAAKDLLSFAGQPTTWGAAPFAAQVFHTDAAVITRLAKAGAVLTGKLSMVELAGGGGYRSAGASLQGPGLNPWDRTRWSGGSSSGSGAAVAAGLAPYALGSETSGSILTPSAFCNVTGLRPTYGLVSRAGAMALSWTMDKIGPMCRSAEDCGLVLQAIAGKDSKDPASAGKNFYFAPQFVRPFADMVIGYSPADWNDYPEPAAQPALQQALEAFRQLGAKVVEAELPDLPYSAVTGTVISAEGSAAFETLIRSGQVDRLADAKQIAGLKAGLEIPAADYLRAMRIRSLVQQAFREIFVTVDVLLAPARNGGAPKAAEPLDAPRPRANAEPRARGLQGLIPAANLAGLPALCLPCGFAEGLPVAVQLVSRPFGENTLLRFGLEYQTRTDWHRRRPKL
ncbi:MAG: amidase [Acidobacteria bacterium]|nr:amidase [Acidobacteriota bacterium]